MVSYHTWKLLSKPETHGKPVQRHSENSFCPWKTCSQNRSGGKELQKLMFLFCKGPCFSTLGRDILTHSQNQKLMKLSEIPQKGTKPTTHTVGTDLPGEWSVLQLLPSLPLLLEPPKVGMYTCGHMTWTWWYSPESTIFTCRVPEQRQGSLCGPDVLLIWPGFGREKPCKSCGWCMLTFVS